MRFLLLLVGLLLLLVPVEAAVEDNIVQAFNLNDNLATTNVISGLVGTPIGNNGTITNNSQDLSSITAVVDRSFFFNQGDAVTFTNPINPWSSDYTLTTFFRVDSSDFSSSIVAFDHSDNFAAFKATWISGGTLQIACNQESGGADVCTAPDISGLSTDTWYFLEVLRDVSANTLNVSINRGEKSSNHTGVTGLKQTNLAQIGSRFGSQFFDGYIDIYNLFSVIKNDTDLDSLYNSGSGFEFPFVSSDPNGTLIVQAQSTFDSSIISGLCASISNSSFNQSGCNSSGTDVFFSGTQANLTTGLFNVSVFSVGVGDGSAGNSSSNVTENFNWTGNQSVQVLSTPLTLVLNFLDEETRLSLSGINISVSVIDSDGNVTDFLTDTGSISISGIFSEGDITVRYGADNFSLRDFFFTLSLDSPLTSETLYLLRDAVFTPGVVEVRDFDGSVVVGDQVVMERYYGNDTIPNQVQAGVTDDQGNVVFVAESVTAFYTFSVFVDGLLVFIDANPQLLVVESDGLWHKPIVLSRTGTDLVNENTGFLYVFSPQGVLSSGIEDNFSFSVNSTSWDLVACTLELQVASSGVVLGSDSGFCSASTGFGVVTFNVSSLDSLLLVATVTTSDFTNTYTQFYQVIIAGNETFTLKNLADDVSGFSGSGFGAFARFFIALIVIIGLTFSLAGNTNLINNPEEMLLLMFATSLLFSYIGWLTLEVVAIHVPELKQWFLSILLGFFTVVVGFRKTGVTE